MLIPMSSHAVLVVADSDGSNAATLFTTAGCAVTVAADAADALTIAATTPLSLVVLPRHPEGMCFHELAAAIGQANLMVSAVAPAIAQVDADWLTPTSNQAASPVGSRAAAPAQSAAPAAPAAATQPEPSAADDSPPIDFSVLATLESDIGDAEFVNATIDIYLDEMPGRLEGIAAGIAAGAPTAFGPAAHSLKSSSAMLGAMQVSATCAKIEALANDHDVAGAAALLSALQAEAAAAAEVLRARLAG